MAKVTVTKNGPYIIETNVPIESSDGKKYPTQEKAWLCRCGHSKNKPFCDGTHAKIGWKEDQ